MKNFKSLVKNFRSLSLLVFSVCVISTLGFSDDQIPSDSQVNAIKDNAVESAQPPALMIQHLNRTIDVLNVSNVNISVLLKDLEQRTGLVFKTADDVQGEVSINVKNIDVFDALRIICDLNGWAFDEEEVGGLKSVLVMTKYEYEKKFGYSFDQDVETVVRKLKYVKVSDVFDGLNKMKSSLGKVLFNDEIGTLYLIDTSNNLESMKKLLEDMDVLVESKVFKLAFIKPEVIAEDVKVLLTPGIGRVQFEPESKELKVTDTTIKIKNVEELISRLDHKRTNVVIEAKTLQIILSDEHQEGVDWAAIVSDYQRLTYAVGESDQAIEAPPMSTGTVSEEDYKVLIDALDTVGAINTISTEKLTSFSGESTGLLIKLFNFFRMNRGESENVEEVQIRLTPMIKDNNQIYMEISPKISFLNSDYKKLSKIKDGEKNVDLPPIQKDRIKVDIEEGGTIVIGGLFKDVTVESLKKIPLLGDLPLLGFAFRNQGKTVRKSEIVIFLTPKILGKNSELGSAQTP